MAKWSTAYIDRLPDSSFLYVNRRTGERKLPVLDRQGRLSIPHLNNAKARLNQTNISDSAKRRIRAEINQLQHAAGVGE